MPFIRDEDRGTEKDGSRSSIYCVYCYKDGEFTRPDITLEEIASLGAGMMSEMYEIPPDKAQKFMVEQLRSLKRWSGRIIPTCHSCGMPLISENDAGTEADGTKSTLYCTYCFQNGRYTDPDLTFEEMVQKSAPLMADQLGMPVEKAEKMVRVYCSTLPRWQ